MAAAIEYRVVHTPEQLNQTINGLVSVGYQLANQTPLETTMIKRKQFSTVWLVVGFLLCVVPLLIYLLVYLIEKDSMIIIRLQDPQVRTGASPMPRPEHLTWTETRSHWWDGERWVDPSLAYPASAPISEDGNQWWDGQNWRPRLPSAQATHAGWDPPAG